MRRWALVLVLGLPLAAAVDAGAQQRLPPPHEWTFGVWTGGIFPPGDVTSPDCFGNPIVIFTRDIVMRISSVDAAYRERTIETVALQASGLEFRFSPATPVMTAMGPRMAPDSGFGCAGSPDALRVERTGQNEMVFPNCAEFPAPLRRCLTPK
jgi:hypothetical protein